MDPFAQAQKDSRQSGRVAAVILAAGLSRRMGENKLLLELNGESVIKRAVEAARAAGLEPLLVVVGHQREKIEAELAGANCQTVLNASYASGMHSSLRAGIAAVPAECAAAVVMLADMPLVTSGMLQALVEAWRRGQAPLVLSLYEGILAPPVLYSRALFAELLEQQGEENRKRVIERHRAEALELTWPGLALTDLDLPADVERIRAQLKKR